jgi:hypothetical protein
VSRAAPGIRRLSQESKECIKRQSAVWQQWLAEAGRKVMKFPGEVLFDRRGAAVEQCTT